MTRKRLISKSYYLEVGFALAFPAVGILAYFFQ